MDETLIAKLTELENSLKELEEDLSKLDISKDPQGYAEMAKRHSDLTIVVGLFNEWKQLNSDIEDAKELLSEDEATTTNHADWDWHMMLLEYTISPNWFFAIQDMYNYGNYYEEKQLHYINTSFGFVKGANRFEIGYGKKRAGIFCVVGVCKEVPSSNGFSLNISSSF